MISSPFSRFSAGLSFHLFHWVLLKPFTCLVTRLLFTGVCDGHPPFVSFSLSTLSMFSLQTSSYTSEFLVQCLRFSHRKVLSLTSDRSLRRLTRSFYSRLLVGDLNRSSSISTDSFLFKYPPPKLPPLSQFLGQTSGLQSFSSTPTEDLHFPYFADLSPGVPSQSKTLSKTSIPLLFV